jgi:transposase
VLNNATCFNNIYIVCGRTDLRYGIDSLAGVLRSLGIENPAAANTLYLFCGRRSDRIKGLVWEGDGFLLLYKKLVNGSFQWPRNASEVKSLTAKQFRWLMEGLTIEPRKSVKEVSFEYMS